MQEDENGIVDQEMKGMCFKILCLLHTDYREAEGSGGAGGKLTVVGRDSLVGTITKGSFLLCVFSNSSASCPLRLTNGILPPGK